MELKAVYFEKPGVDNTEEALCITKQRAQELGIKTVVVASTTGYTAVKAMEILDDLKVIAVTHSEGFRESNKQEFTQENRKMFEEKGGIVLTTTHVLGGLDRAMGQGSIEQSPRAYVIGDIVAQTLRIFGQGMKVACEITAMATDGGLVRTDEDVIAVAGTGGEGGGADLAVVLKPANSQALFEMKIKEILCKPHF